MAPSLAAGTDDGVQFVDEHDDATVAVLNFFQHSFESIFEFAAIFGTSHKGSEVKSPDLFITQVGRDVAEHNAMGKPFDDGRLSDSGFADEDGVILASA